MALRVKERSVECLVKNQDSVSRGGVLPALMFCQRLSDSLSRGGQISLVQIYTVARQPAESFVTPLADAEVDRIVELVRSKTGIQTVGYYGYSS